MSRPCCRPNFVILVPEAGIEPAWTFWIRGILSPLRLPISPLRHVCIYPLIQFVTWSLVILRPSATGLLPVLLPVPIPTAALLPDRPHCLD